MATNSKEVDAYIARAAEFAKPILNHLRQLVHKTCPETEEKIKEETKATIRCIPLDNPKEEGKCVYSGKASTQRVLFAIAY